MITLTTDFGSDYYVAEMKGMIYKIDPNAKIVDVRHDVTRQSILEGAFILKNIVNRFPDGTIHVGVVDPGVGSSRRCLVFRTGKCTLIGPDNGLLTLALRDQEIKEIYEISYSNIIREVKPYTNISISKTFHGRDVFGPAAALISLGKDPSLLGDSTDEFEELYVAENTVLYVDAYGNVVTNVKNELALWDEVTIQTENVECSGKFVETFSDVERGGIAVYYGSHGFLEVGVNSGDAGKLLKTMPGKMIRIQK